jgi:hypothetical protein
VKAKNRETYLEPIPLRVVQGHGWITKMRGNRKEVKQLEPDIKYGRSEVEGSGTPHADRPFFTKDQGKTVIC